MAVAADGRRITFLCPFCAGQVEAGHGKAWLRFLSKRFGIRPSASFGVLHIKPECRRFLDLEPDEFLFQARVKIGGN